MKKTLFPRGGERRPGSSNSDRFKQQHIAELDKVVKALGADKLPRPPLYEVKR